MDYPLSNIDLQWLLEDDGLFGGVFSYNTLPELRDGQFCIANTDNIYPGLDPVEGGHHWVTVCCSSDLLLVFDSSGRSAQMEKEYTDQQPRAYSSGLTPTALSSQTRSQSRIVVLLCVGAMPF